MFGAVRIGKRWRKVAALVAAMSLFATALFSVVSASAYASTPTSSIATVGDFGLGGNYQGSMALDFSGNLFYVDNGYLEVIPSQPGVSVFGSPTVPLGSSTFLNLPTGLRSYVNAVAVQNVQGCGEVLAVAATQTNSQTGPSLWVDVSKSCTLYNESLAANSWKDVATAQSSANSAFVQLAVDSSGDIFAIEMASSYATSGQVEVLPALSSVFGSPETPGVISTVGGLGPNTVGLTLAPFGGLFSTTSSGKLITLSKSATTIFGVSIPADTPTTVSNQISHSETSLTFLFTDSGPSLYLLDSSGTQTQGVDVMSGSSATVEPVPLLSPGPASSPVAPTVITGDSASATLLMATSTNLYAMPLFSSGSSGNLVDIYGVPVPAGLVSPVASAGVYQPADIVSGGRSTDFSVSYFGSSLAAYSSVGQEIDGTFVPPDTTTCLCTLNFYSSTAIATDSNDDLFVADSLGISVVPFSASSSHSSVTFLGQSMHAGVANLLTSVNSSLPGQAAGRYVTSMAYDPTTGTLAVGYNTGSLYIFNQDFFAGRSSVILDHAPSTQEVTGLAFDPSSGSLWVAFAGRGTDSIDSISATVADSSPYSGPLHVDHNVPTNGLKGQILLGLSTDQTGNLLISESETLTSRTGSVWVVPQSGTTTFLGQTVTSGSLNSLDTGLGAINGIAEIPGLGTNGVLLSDAPGGTDSVSGSLDQLISPELATPLSPGTPQIVSGNGGAVQVNYSAPSSGPTPTSYVVYLTTTNPASGQFELVGAESTQALTASFNPASSGSGQYVAYVAAVIDGLYSFPAESQSFTPPPSPASVSPTSISFVTTYGSPFSSAPQYATYTEPTTSSSSFTFPNPTISGSFSLDAVDSTCPGATLAPGQSCRIYVEPSQTISDTVVGVETGSISVSGLQAVSLSAEVKATSPGAPASVSATEGTSSTTYQDVVVAFAQPVSDGGDPILSYSIGVNDLTTSTSSSITVQASTLTGSGPYSKTITGLKVGHNYSFSVSASNSVGSGASTTSNSVSIAVPTQTPVLPVPSPAALTFTSNFGSVAAPQQKVTYKEPQTPAPFAFPSITVTGDSADFSVSSNSCSGTKLSSAGATCSVVVSPTSTAVGTAIATLSVTGYPSLDVKLTSTVKAAVADDSPRHVTATAGIEGANVSFQLPAIETQEEPIFTGYKVVPYDITLSQSGSPTTGVISGNGGLPIDQAIIGLNPGDQYQFTVTLTRSGVSSKSAVSKIVKVGSVPVPKASASSLAFSTVSGQKYGVQVLTYTEPRFTSLAGQSLAYQFGSFSISHQGDASLFSVVNGCTKLVSGLASGASCTVSVTPSTSLASPFSAALDFAGLPSVTLESNVPPAPSSLLATAGVGSATIGFSMPSTGGVAPSVTVIPTDLTTGLSGSPIVSGTSAVQSVSSGVLSGNAVTPYDIQISALTPNNEYSFFVYLANSYGAGLGATTNTITVAAQAVAPTQPSTPPTSTPTPPTIPSQSPSSPPSTTPVTVVSNRSVPVTVPKAIVSVPTTRVVVVPAPTLPSSPPTTSQPSAVTTTTQANRALSALPSTHPPISGSIRFILAKNAAIPGAIMSVKDTSLPVGCTSPEVLFDGTVVARPSLVHGSMPVVNFSVPGDTTSGRSVVTLQCIGNTFISQSADVFITVPAVHRGLLSTAILLPSQISFSAKAILKSAAIAVFAIPFVAFPTEFMNSTLEEHEDDVAALLARFRRRRRKEQTRRTKRQNNIRLTLVLMASAALYGLLDPKFSFNEESLLTFLGLLVGLAVVTFANDLPEALYLRKKDPEAVVQGHVLPGAIGIAAICVVISRAVHFQPGYLYGMVAGLRVVNNIKISEEDSGRAKLYSAVTTLVVSIVAWLLRQPLSHVITSNHAGVLAIGVDAALVSIFIAGIQGVLIGLLPLKYLPGRELFKWNKVIWGLIFVLTSFVFVHLLLGNGSEYVGTINGGIAAAIFIGIFLGATALVWAFFVVYDKRHESEGPPEVADDNEPSEGGAEGDMSASEVSAGQGQSDPSGGSAEEEP